MSEKDIEREYRVVKSNELIQKARFNLSVIEQKTLAYIISKIKPTDSELLEYTFSIVDYCKVCGIDYSNGKNYANIKATLKQLRDKSFWIHHEDGTECLCSWLSKVRINKGSGSISIRLDEDLSNYLIQLHEKFTQYELINILPMRSQYSVRLYELLKSYSFTKSHTFEIDELKKLLSAENYIRFPDFRRKVLDIALSEINQFADLNVKYEPITKGRKVIKLNFIIKKTTAIEQLINKNKSINTLTKK